MQDYTVVGIHGLLNKAPADTLADWWQQALHEGLQRNHEVAAPELRFRLAYWADVRNPSPVAVSDELQPYTPAPDDGPLPRYDSGILDGVRAVAQKWGGRMVDKGKDLIGVGPGVEQLLGVKLPDLGEYYASAGVRAAVRTRLRDVLEAHRGQRILLVAHSMGSIVAYDVLRESEATDFGQLFLLTIGAPLGLPLVTRKIRAEFGTQRTPENVTRWDNLSDPRDRIALDCNLAEEYAPNDRGVAVKDEFLVNGYVSPAGEVNNHKIYGYLRAPEFSERLKAFLGL